MNLKVNDIVTLENNNKYTILKIVENSNTYYFAMGQVNNIINPDDVIFFKVDSSYIEIIDDKSLLKELVKLV